MQGRSQPAPEVTVVTDWLILLEETIQAKGWAVHHRAELPYHWEVREPRLLVGLRTAALVSLWEEHGWEKHIATAFLDKWLANSASEMSTYLACLNAAAMEELTHRIMNAREDTTDGQKPEATD